MARSRDRHELERAFRRVRPPVAPLVDAAVTAGTGLAGIAGWGLGRVVENSHLATAGTTAAAIAVPVFLGIVVNDKVATALDMWAVNFGVRGPRRYTSKTPRLGVPDTAEEESETDVDDPDVIVGVLGGSFAKAVVRREFQEKLSARLGGATVALIDLSEAGTDSEDLVAQEPDLDRAICNDYPGRTLDAVFISSGDANIVRQTMFKTQHIHSALNHFLGSKRRPHRPSMRTDGVLTAYAFPNDFSDVVAVDGTVFPPFALARFRRWSRELRMSLAEYIEDYAVNEPRRADNLTVLKHHGRLLYDGEHGFHQPAEEVDALIEDLLDHWERPLADKARTNRAEVARRRAATEREARRTAAQTRARMRPARPAVPARLPRRRRPS